MYKLTNKHDRRIGLPAPKHGGILLAIGETQKVTNDHFKELSRSEKTKGWLASGDLIAEKVDP